MGEHAVDMAGRCWGVWWACRAVWCWLRAVGACSRRYSSQSWPDQPGLWPSARCALLHQEAATSTFNMHSTTTGSPPTQRSMLVNAQCRVLPVRSVYHPLRGPLVYSSTFKPLPATRDLCAAGCSSTRIAYMYPRLLCVLFTSLLYLRIVHINPPVAQQQLDREYSELASGCTCLTDNTLQ